MAERGRAGRRAGRGAAPARHGRLPRRPAGRGRRPVRRRLPGRGGSAEDRRSQAWSLQNLAWVTTTRGDFAGADATLGRAARLFADAATTRSGGPGCGAPPRSPGCSPAGCRGAPAGAGVPAVRRAGRRAVGGRHPARGRGVRRGRAGRAGRGRPGGPPGVPRVRRSSTTTGVAGSRWWYAAWWPVGWAEPEHAYRPAHRGAAVRRADRPSAADRHGRYHPGVRRAGPRRPGAARRPTRSAVAAVVETHDGRWSRPRSAPGCCSAAARLRGRRSASGAASCWRRWPTSPGGGGAAVPAPPGGGGVRDRAAARPVGWPRRWTLARQAAAMPGEDVRSRVVALRVLARLRLTTAASRRRRVDAAAAEAVAAAYATAAGQRAGRPATRCWPATAYPMRDRASRRTPLGDLPARHRDGGYWRSVSRGCTAAPRPCPRCPA